MQDETFAALHPSGVELKDAHVVEDVDDETRQVVPFRVHKPEPAGPPAGKPNIPTEGGGPRDPLAEERAVDRRDFVPHQNPDWDGRFGRIESATQEDATWVHDRDLVSHQRAPLHPGDCLRVDPGMPGVHGLDVAWKQRDDRKIQGR